MLECFTVLKIFALIVAVWFGLIGWKFVQPGPSRHT